MSVQNINFYGPNEPYFEFSNFYSILDDKKFTLMIDGQSWQSTEHYYHAQKFLGSMATVESREYSELIRTADTPNKALVLARQKILSGYAVNWKHSKNLPTKINDIIRSFESKEIKIRPDWSETKYDVMYKANLHKYKQNAKLRRLLLSTGEAQLTEHTDRDKYWGDGGDGSGLNKLGQILMQIRSELILSKNML